MQPSRNVERLLEIMAALRDPRSGCPWDLQQTFRTIVPFTIEEAYEVADAVERDDPEDLKDELGDLLLQVVFHSRMAEEAGAFDFGAVVEGICRKLIRRHPHVFGAARELGQEEVKRLWDEIKQAEKAERQAEREDPRGLLAGVPAAMPALTRAVKLTREAAKVGFDWPDAAQVIAKVREEVDEVEAAIAAEAASTGDRGHIEDELGDLLFAVANLARHLNLDPESALRGANAKFQRRFGFIETSLTQRGKPLEEAGLAEMEALWAEAKSLEKGAGSAHEPSE